jgi:hypothetical protein
MILPGSRYQNSGTFTVSRCNGNVVIQALCLPLPRPALVQGYYRRGTGQRLDLIANAFLKDATAFWQLCDANNSVSPDALAARTLVGIPLATP